MSGHSYLSLCNCGFSSERSYYNRYTSHRRFKRLEMSRVTHLRRPITQHLGAQKNNALHRITNDIINIKLQSSTANDVNNIRNSTLYKCKLRQKRLLRHRNNSYKDNVQEMYLRNHTIYERGNYEGEYDYPEMNLDDLDTRESHKINSANVTTEFGPDSPGYDENKSEINEKTEQDLQNQNELNVVYYSNDYEYIIEPTYILDKNKETAEPTTKEQNKVEIIENIIIKSATSRNNDELQTSDTDVLNTTNDSSIFEENGTLQTVIDHHTNVAKQIDDNDKSSVKKDETSESSEEMLSKQANNNSKVDEIEPIASTSKDTTTEIGSEQFNGADKSVYTDVDKAAKFDNFKVPKMVAHSKKIIVKKQQTQFILTHVVEGFIIQESNFAFPIRNQKAKPQSSTKKETAPTEDNETEEPVPPTEVKREENITIEPTSDTEVKDEMVDQVETGTVEVVPLTELPIEVKEEETYFKEECNTEESVPSTEVKPETVDQTENVTIEPGSPIEVKDEETEFKEENITEEQAPPTEVKEELKEEVQNGDSNPFVRLQQSTVRSWTLEDLSNYLRKSHWEETASLLEDNEIDGATLFMVTKSQLMIIGVAEEQADVISEYIQSGPSRGN